MKKEKEKRNLKERKSLIKKRKKELLGTSLNFASSNPMSGNTLKRELINFLP
jgi:hypothetical protein